MTIINKTQTDFLENKYSYNENNQINSSNKFATQLDSTNDVKNTNTQNVLASLSTDISFDDYKNKR